jgi:hypothetical protein
MSESESRVHRIAMTEEAARELRKSSKKRFYQLLEVEYVRGPEISLPKLAERYNVSGSSVIAYAKRHGWKEKRAKYKAELESARASNPTALRGAFRDFVTHQLQGIAYRANVLLNRELEGIEKTEAGLLKGDDAEKDSVGDLTARSALLKEIMGLGALVHGPLEVELPTDVNFEVVIKEQRVRFQKISNEEVEAPAPEHIIDIPPGLTRAEVEGVPGEEFE